MGDVHFRLWPVVHIPEAKQQGYSALSRVIDMEFFKFNVENHSDRQSTTIIYIEETRLVFGCELETQPSPRVDLLCRSTSKASGSRTQFDRGHPNRGAASPASLYTEMAMRS